jgi:hypothetical protein
MRERTGELLEPMARAARMIEGHMEGLNSLFSAVRCKACGCRTVEYMTSMLYFVAGKLTLPCY